MLDLSSVVVVGSVRVHLIPQQLRYSFNILKLSAWEWGGCQLLLDTAMYISTEKRLHFSPVCI